MLSLKIIIFCFHIVPYLSFHPIAETSVIFLVEKLITYSFVGFLDHTVDFNDALILGLYKILYVCELFIQSFNFVVKFLCGWKGLSVFFKLLEIVQLSESADF